MGPAMKNAVPHSHYPTKDGRWVAVACTSDKIFERLAALMGMPEVAGDGKWGTYPARDRLRNEVDAAVTHWSSGLDRDDLLRECEAAQVPCGSVYGIDEIFEDPQYKFRGNIQFIDDARAGGEIAMQDVVPRMSATPGGIEWLGAALGAHNEEIYGSELGFSDEEISALLDNGII